MKIKKHYIILLVIMVFAAVTWSMRLGDLTLWSDEGHTAFLAKSIEDNILPKAWDGRNLMTGVQAEDSNEDFIITWDQPLQFYVTLASFKLFGEGKAQARLPFLLAGLLCIPLLYIFVFKFTGNRNIALLSAFVLSLTVLFFMHARQCRYYTLTSLFALTLFISYIDLERKKFAAALLYIISLIGLFYSNLLGLFTVSISLALYLFICDFSWPRLKRMAIFTLVSLPAMLPWFIYARLWSKSSPFADAGLGIRIWKLLIMLSSFNRGFFPLVIILITLYLLLRKRLYYNKKFYYLALSVIVPPLFITPFILLPAIRYLIYLIPFCAFLTALLTAELYRRKKVFAYIFFVLIIFTKVFNNFMITIPQWCLAIWGPKFITFKEDIIRKYGTKESTTKEWLGKADRRLAHSITPMGIADSIIKMEYAGYIHEITHDYRDPLDGVIDFLKTHAKPEDEVVLSVDSLSLIYYTPEFRHAFMAEPREGNRDKAEKLPPYIFSYENAKWFIPRRIKMIKGPFISEEDFIASLKRRGLKYKKHTINYQKFQWDGSRPENFSKYAIKHSDRPKSGDKVVIYEVIR